MVEEPRVGVFVCHCGINIGAYVNVPEVVNYAETLNGVVYSEANLYTCSSEGLQKIKESIIKHRLNRVVVASCTPRTHEPLFQSTCESAGLNKYLFEMANIRDQCSWVHMNEPDKATQKAKDLVRMAVAKARLLTPEHETEVEVTPTCLVIGGGASGITAASSLSKQGFNVHLVEKKGRLGGMLNELNTLYPSNLEAARVLNQLLNQITNSPNVKIHLESTIKDVRGFIGNFEVEVSTPSGSKQLKVGTIIVATGSDYLYPQGLFGYGDQKNVITQMELEQKMKEDSLGSPQTVVMIQCAGARTEERPYCSRICCTEAMKNAELLASEDPKRKLYILYRDLQTYGVEFSEMEWEAKRSGVKLIKYDKQDPPSVTQGSNGPLVKVYSPLLGEELTIESNLVVLSTPLIPAEDNKTLSQILKVPLNSDGFFMEAHVKLRPVDFATDGIYVCGTAHSPKSLGESISQAMGAASRACIPMAKKKIRAAAITSIVDETKCSGCGTCVELCAYNAITKNEIGIAQVTEAICKGCGVCGASCPEKAITMRHFTDEELQAQAYAALQEM
jgi:heterodisulfide reductase subunit A